MRDLESNGKATTGAENDLALRTREITYLIQISNVNRNWNVRRVSIVQKMFQPDLHRNRTDDLTEACHLQILHTPDLKHQRPELLADKAHPPFPEINAVKMALGESIPNRIVRKRKCINHMEKNLLDGTEQLLCQQD